MPYPVADCHCDTLLKRFMYEREMSWDMVTDGFEVTKDSMRAGNVALQVHAMFVPDTFRDMALRVALEMMVDSYQLEMDHDLVRVDGPDDIEELSPEQPGFILALEGSLPLGTDTKLLPVFYGMGVRVLTLVWSRPNAFCDGVGNERGLSEQGIKLIRDCEDIGIIVDLSHASEATFWDAMNSATRPMLCSHSCCSKFSSEVRNINDEQMQALAEAGGMLCIAFFSGFLNGTDKASIADVVKHIEYAVDIMGPDKVGLGSDFDGLPFLPTDLKGPEDYPAIEEALRKTGMEESTIEGVMGGNLMRFFRENL